MKVLAITNLFGYPWDPSRGVYNQQQFRGLARHVELSILVAVPWPEALSRPRAYWTARRDGRRRWPGVDYFIFWYPPRVLQSLHAWFFLLSLALQRPATLLPGRWQVMIGSWAFPDGVATAAIGRISSTPVLLKVHGTDVNDYLARPGRRGQILAAMHRSQAVLAVSDALRSRLADCGVPRHKITVLYNGVDAELFAAADGAARVALRSRAGVADGESLLLFVGNLKPAKGCIDLLEAFAALPAALGPMRLAFIGDGPAAAALRRRIVELGLGERVRLLGKLEHRRLPDWYAAADLVCLPSHAEGVPNVLLEAMACGVPVVAARVGGVAEIVPEFAGALHATQDPAALAEALCAALTRSWDRGRIAAHARQFDWDRNIEGLLGLLRDVAASGEQAAWT